MIRVCAGSRLHFGPFAPPPDEGRVGRGKRSALGVHGFAQGGFLVEAGKRDADGVAPLTARADFPEDWRVVLVLPPWGQGLHGAAEGRALQGLQAGAWPLALTDA